MALVNGTSNTEGKALMGIEVSCDRCGKLTKYDPVEAATGDALCPTCTDKEAKRLASRPIADYLGTEYACQEFPTLPRDGAWGPITLYRVER